jgi:DNA repair protein RecN (Recombination protein N)
MDERLQAIIRPILASEEIDDNVDELVIVREVKANGGTVSRVNGSRVSTKILQELGENLIDIHGQGSHLSLLRPKSHLPLLDRYGNLVREREVLGKEVSALRMLQKELASLQQDERAIAQRIDMLTFQVTEIDAAKLQAGEEEELKGERKRLGNVESLMRYSAEAAAILLNEDDELPSAIDLLNQVERALMNLARLDDSQNELSARVTALVEELDDIAREVSDYGDSLEYDPERLAEVEERIELINNLKRKYGESIEEILRYRDLQAAQLNRFERSGERTEELQIEIEKYLREIGKLALALSKKRQEVAKKLAFTIERELRDLRMTARFEVEFQTVPDQTGVYVDDQRLAFDHSGFDKAEFLLSTNPGEPLKPMAKVASGGETARIMLALKTALAEVDDTPTLIFDEIDQGIGGRIGETVGRKLWGLTAVADHQVIVVTHLPQLAGYGDRHFHVRKDVHNGRTRTAISQLESAERINELAAMIGTDITHARGGAAAILEKAAEVKQRVRGSS